MHRRTPAIVLLMLAWPAILEQLLLTMATYVDTAMIGSLGANATAAVAINSSTGFLLMGMAAAVGVGYSVQVAHCLGAGDLERAKEVSRQALVGAAAAGLALMTCAVVLSPWIPRWLGADADILKDAQRYLFFYSLGLPLQTELAVFSAVLRCAGDTKTPLMFNTGANLLNVALNYFFIFPSRTVVLFGRSVSVWGAGLGAGGAAMATALSGGTAGLLLVTLMFLRPSPVRLMPGASYRPNLAVVRQAVRLGVPVALERVTISSGQLIMTRLVSSLGNVSLAANHVAVTAEGISYLPAQGISFAATTVVGQSVGAGQPEQARRYGRVSGWVGLWSGVFGGILLFVLAVPLARVFSPDPQVIQLAAKMLRIVAVSEPCFGLAIVLSGVLRGAGDTRSPFLVVLGGMWGVRIVLAPILMFCFSLGLSAIWLAMVADLIARGLLCLARVCRVDWPRMCCQAAGSK